MERKIMWVKHDTTQEVYWGIYLLKKYLLYYLETTRLPAADFGLFNVFAPSWPTTASASAAYVGVFPLLM